MVKLSSRALPVIGGMAVALLAAGVIFAYWWRSPAPAWLTVAVRQGDIVSTINATGKIDAIERVNVGAQASGQIKSLKIRIGERVRKGQIIAEIDDLPQRNDLQIAEAALSATLAERQARRATLSRNEAQFRRQQRMLTQDAASRQEYEAAAEALASAQAGLQMLESRIVQARIEVEKKRLELGYTRIAAPMDGMVIAIVARQGQTLNASQSAPVIARLAQLDTMVVRVKISEADVSHIAPGQQAWFFIFSEPNRRYNATLRSIELAPESVMKEESSATTENAAAPANSAVYYHALLEVPNPENKLRIAMTAQVSLLREKAEKALLIPLQAVKRTADNQPYVEVPGDDHLPQRRSIVTGISDNINVQVVAGLRPGEEVILADNSSDENEAQP